MCCILCASWYPGVINVFTDKNNFTNVKPENMESFYNSVTTLVSTQVCLCGDLGSCVFVKKEEWRRVEEITVQYEYLLLALKLVSTVTSCVTVYMS